MTDTWVCVKIYIMMRAEIIPTADATKAEIEEIMGLTAAYASHYVVVQNDPDIERAESVRTARAEHPITFVDLGHKASGKAEAIRRGIGVALAVGNFDTFIQVDGHLKQNPAQIGLLLDAQRRDGSDMAICNRYADVELDEHRLALTQLFSRFAKLSTGLELSDTVCGTRTYSRAIAEMIFKYSMSVGYGIESEENDIVWQSGGTISQVGVESNEQASSTAAPKLVDNAYLLCARTQGRFSASQYTILQGFAYALPRFADYRIPGEDFDMPYDVQCTFVEDGEDGEPSYELHYV
ncbi:MAG: hypothetical protein WDN27_02615 [Candidatus Saccharibacteria bacterium]